MTPQSSFRSCWTQHRRATRMWVFLLLALILQSVTGNIVGDRAGDVFVIHSEEGNFSLSFNGSHIIYYGSDDYYYENTTYELDYSPYEYPVTIPFGNSASCLLQSPLTFFLSLLHPLCVLLQDIGM